MTRRRFGAAYGGPHLGFQVDEEESTSRRQAKDGRAPELIPQTQLDAPPVLFPLRIRRAAHASLRRRCCRAPGLALYNAHLAQPSERIL